MFLLYNNIINLEGVFMRQRNVKNKEEIINNSKYYIENPLEFRGKWNEVFQNSHPIMIEIGTGKGNFIIENAKKHKEINYIGIERNDSILALALKKIPEGLSNLRMLKFDAFFIDKLFFNEVSLIYLNFSDPWPKKRHEKRRLTSLNFLKKYEIISKDKVNISMKTDNKDLFSYSILMLNNNDYKFSLLTFDLENYKDIENIKTEYEEKFTKLNSSIYLVIATKMKNK